MKKTIGWKSSLLLTLIGLFFLFLGYSQVRNTVTPQDQYYINKILEENYVAPYKNDGNYFHQINFIQAAQYAVLGTTPIEEALPLSHTREPQDLYLAHRGRCYDRSRTLEKILRMSGFKIRHVSLYALENHSKLKTLLTPNVRSHALTEVLTEKGWLAVDPNKPWISIDQAGNPISLHQMQQDASTSTVIWNKDLEHYMNGIYKVPFIYVYGLYSRTGKMYPPYLSLWPNINWKEFLYNF